MVYRETYAAKKCHSFINKVQQNAISVIRYIKSRVLNSRLFIVLYNEMRSDHIKLLHTRVRWLFRGKTLVIIFEFRNEIDTKFSS